MIWLIPGQYLCFCCKVLDVLEAEVHPIRTHVQRLDRFVDKAAKPKLIITSSLRNSLQINFISSIDIKYFGFIFYLMTKETKMFLLLHSPLLIYWEPEPICLELVSWKPRCRGESRCPQHFQTSLP